MPIIVAVITVVGSLIVGYWQFVRKPSLPASTPTPAVRQVKYVGRILDNVSGEPVGGAKVTFDFLGDSLIAYTDSEGMYRFFVEIDSGRKELFGQLRIEAGGYEKYDRYITLFFSNPNIEDIRLQPVSEMFDEQDAEMASQDENISILSGAVSTNTLMLEDFESYEDGNIMTYFRVNDAENANLARLLLVDSPYIHEGKHTAGLYFDIRNPRQRLNYSGFETVFPPMDWSNYSRLCVWVKIEAESDDEYYFVVQFGEAGAYWPEKKPENVQFDEVWKYKTEPPLSVPYEDEICMSLTKNFFLSLNGQRRKMVRLI